MFDNDVERGSICIAPGKAREWNGGWRGSEHGPECAAWGLEHAPTNLHATVPTGFTRRFDVNRRLFCAITAALVLGACGTPATPNPTPSPIPAPTETPIPPTATLEPSPTPDPLLFRDDFEGALGDGWHWLREKPQYWSLTSNPGWLEIKARSGGVGGAPVPITNLLLREPPAGNFQLDTRLKFRPAGNYQIGGLLAYESDGRYVQFGRAFCNAPACAGDGFYLDYVVNGNLMGSNFATGAPETDTVLLRLRRVGDTYSGLVSEDGERWTLIGSHQDGPQPIFIGIVAGQAVGTVPGPAQFDYFTVSALP